MGTGRVRTSKSYLDCQMYVDTLVSRWTQSETGVCDDNQWTCGLLPGLPVVRRYISLTVDSVRDWGL